MATEKASLDAQYKYLKE